MEVKVTLKFKGEVSSTFMNRNDEFVCIMWHSVHFKAMVNGWYERNIITPRIHKINIKKMKMLRGVMIYWKEKTWKEKWRRRASGEYNNGELLINATTEENFGRM